MKLEEIKFHHQCDVLDWSQIKYMVRCHWGVKVTSEYPNPVIEEFYFENFSDMENFVQWYETENGSINKKILLIQEIAKTFRIETYQVATKVRVVQ